MSLTQLALDIDCTTVRKPTMTMASVTSSSQEKMAKRVQIGGFSTFASPSRNSSSQDACLMTAS